MRGLNQLYDSTTSRVEKHTVTPTHSEVAKSDPVLFSFLLYPTEQQSRPNLTDLISRLQCRMNALATDSHLKIHSKQILTDEELIAAFGFHHRETQVDVNDLLYLDGKIISGNKLEHCCEHGWIMVR